MTYIYDASFGHAQITPSALTRAGSGGVILYAGCDETSKNCTKAELSALLAGGFLVGLVIENFATDAVTKGAPEGDRQGRNLAAAARALGYDIDNCVGFAGYDTDSHPDDWPKIRAFMEAFSRHIPVTGYYGDSDSIDYLHQSHPDWIYWQSNSTSFSPKNPTPNAHLLQLYNDPRAHGLPVDVDLVERTPLRLMGEDLPITDTDVQKIVVAVKQAIIDKDGETVASALRRLDNIGANLLAVQKSIAELKDELDAVKAAQSSPAGGTLNVTGTLKVS